jgi:hypothetical protein
VQRLFKVPLLTHGNTWDSVRTTEGGRTEPFVAQLPHYSNDMARGHNTVTMRAEFFQLAGYDRIYAAVLVGSSGGGGGGGGAPPGSSVPDFSREIMAHVALRMDGGAAAAAQRYVYVQGYRHAGRWETPRKPLTAAQLGLLPSKPFWWRLVLDARGLFSYVDGKFMSFTPHAAGGAPADGETLCLVLPVTGHAGEKATLRAHAVYWGHSKPDLDGERAYAEWAATAGAAAAAGGTDRVPVPNEVYVNGLPPGAAQLDVLAAFEKYGVSDVRLLPGPGGGAIVQLMDAKALPRVCAEMHRATVLGAVINVTQNMRVVPRGSVGSSGGAGGARDTDGASASATTAAGVAAAMGWGAATSRSSGSGGTPGSYPMPSPYGTSAH